MLPSVVEIIKEFWKFTSDKLINLFFAFCVLILKLMQISPYIKTVWRNNIGFTFDEMFCLPRRNVRYRGKHMRQMGRGTLDTIPIFNEIVFNVKSTVRNYLQITCCCL